MKTILVPLDGSELAERTLPYVRLLATMLSANIQLLRVVSPGEKELLLASEAVQKTGHPDQPDYAQREQQTQKTLKHHGLDYLEVQAKRLRDAGAKVEILVQPGIPVDTILETAVQHHATMIAMGTHGYSGIRRWALGGTTDRVVHGAVLPVLVIRGDALPARPIQRILVPLDGSALAKQALAPALELAIAAHAQLILLTAVMPPIDPTPLISPIAHAIRPYTEVLSELCDSALLELNTIQKEISTQVSTLPLVVTGYPAEVIVDEARRCETDLIIMATHGYSGLRRWALGSTAHKVLHTSTTPLLLVRAQH